jgi:lysophospholipase L1-like esterase
MLYLPLYNGVSAVALGVPERHALARAPVWPGGPHRPICFYGTSITQGGCASRPGMAYPAIVGRALNRPTWNFGFSGNARSEPEIARLLARLDPSVYHLDPLPNMSPELVAENIEPFVRILRAARPDTPIVLVEKLTPRRAFAARLSDPEADWARGNRELRAACERLIASGVRGLHYVQGAGLLGADFEGTVDGVHPTDVGFLRMAEVFTQVLAGLV